MERKGIAVAGSVLVDKINTISGYPEIGQLTQISDVQLAVGGCVPNVALDLKKLDPELPVWAMGKIGRDAEGQHVLDSLRGDGVNTDYIIESDNKTSFTEVMSIAGGQRTFFCYAGASADYGYDDISFTSIAPKILHLGYFLLLKKVDEGDGIRILKMAKEQGLLTSIDLVSENSDRYGLVKPCLPYTDYLIINELEAGKLTDLAPVAENLTAMGQKLLCMGVREKVIIHMPEMAVCCSREEESRLGSYVLPEGFIQGTTGAGDAFCAGALMGIHEGISQQEILAFASACAVMALRCPDATSGLADKQAVMDFCQRFPRR